MDSVGTVACRAIAVATTRTNPTTALRNGVSVSAAACSARL
jgi:hypothetical protein